MEILKQEKKRRCTFSSSLIVYSLSMIIILLLFISSCVQKPGIYRFTLTVNTSLPSGSVPMDPMIDFGKMIAAEGISGVLDPNSITIVNKVNGQTIPFNLHEDFAYGDRGRLEWVIKDKSDTIYEISFQTVAKRPPLQPKAYIPPVGVGDLLRYNAGESRPITLPYSSKLIDLTGDGKPDLVGCWSYAYRPGLPWGGIVCYPRIGDNDKLEFEDLVHLRYVSHVDSTDYKFFNSIYSFVDFADFNRDGLPDIVYGTSENSQLYFYLNTGKRDEGGMPVFVASDTVSRYTDKWSSCRAIDLDLDGAIDIVIDGLYLRNMNPEGWPVKFDEPVSLEAGIDPCFYDVDGDGIPDAVCLEEIPDVGINNYRIVWKKNIGMTLPQFGTPQLLPDIDVPYPRSIAVVNDGSRRGLLINYNHWEETAFYGQINTSGTSPRFKKLGICSSLSAVLILSDQAWPYFCDWDNDGDLDMLVGGGYGWPRILVNEGTSDRMSLKKSEYILSEGEPVRITRNQVFGGDHWHDMGYPYPVYIDWDHDGLPDLMLPNETNRIFWYKNIGTAEQPKFGPQLQIICDGYPDSPELRHLSYRHSVDTMLNTPYPTEKEQPFFWRTGAAFADWNNDGLMDFITHDGFTRKATLFTQYKDKEGNLRLKKAYALELSDGRLIDDSIVNRVSHWTESFKAVDWDADGLIDLVYSCAGSTGNSSIYFLKNVGTKESPLFAAPRTLKCYGEPIKVTNHGPQPWVGDLDGDGKPDIVTCVEHSVYPYFSHNAIEMESRPVYTLSELENPSRGN